MRGHDISAHNIDFSNMELVAARRFTLDGKEMNEGDVVPEGAIPQRRARQMFERRMLTIRAKTMAAGDAPEAPEQAAEAPEATDTTEAAPEAAPEAASAPDSGEQGGALPVTAENGYKAEHEGFGRWYVYGPNGEQVSGPHKKAQIEHLIAD